MHVARISDEWKEAEWIAEHIVELHDDGARWSDVAVLCRSSRLFFSLQQAFAEREIPVEILGLAGLLRLPEIVEVLAYARAVSDPLASVALAQDPARPAVPRRLQGPGARRGARPRRRATRCDWWTRKRARRRRSCSPRRSSTWTRWSDCPTTGRRGSRSSARSWRELRVEARKPVGEFLGEVVRRTGILAELDAHTDQVAATAAKRNLAAFMDQVHAFEPVEGELTLRAFLDYVDTVERMDKQEWSPVQPSAEDSVKVMTIHAAKGLEFDNVFVPGMAKGLLPSTRIQHNPAERGKSMDFELRGDARDPAEVRRRAVPLQAGPAGAGGIRGAPHGVRRPDARAHAGSSAPARIGTART